MAERLKRIGTGTILLPNRPGIAQTAAIVGKKEGEGPLHSEFDAVIEDDLFGEETWEKAESRFHYTAADTCLKKAGATPESVDVTLGGDLLNQIMAASTAAQKLQTPFLGIYGACSTMAETLCIGAMLCDGGYARRALCCASSHFCSAERQYRFPLDTAISGRPRRSGRSRARALRCWTHRRAARFAARRTSPWGASSIWRLRT